MGQSLHGDSGNFSFDLRFTWKRIQSRGLWVGDGGGGGWLPPSVGPPLYSERIYQIDRKFAGKESQLWGFRGEGLGVGGWRGMAAIFLGRPPRSEIALTIRLT